MDGYAMEMNFVGRERCALEWIIQQCNTQFSSAASFQCEAFSSSPSETRGHFQHEVFTSSVAHCSNDTNEINETNEQNYTNDINDPNEANEQNVLCNFSVNMFIWYSFCMNH